MGFLSQGGVTVLFAVAGLVLLAAALLPMTHWAVFSMSVNNDTISSTCSLWEFCVSTDFNGTSSKDCAALDRLGSGTMQWGGAIAGVILAMLFTLLSLIPVCCRKRGVIVVLQAISVICSIGGIVAFCFFKTMALDKEADATFKYQHGLYLTGVAAGAGLLAMLGAYWVKPSDDYSPVGPQND